MTASYSPSDPTAVNPTAGEPAAFEPNRPAAPHPRLTRSTSNKWLGGVCGGLAARYGWDATLIRALFVLSILLPGPQVLLYLALWIIIPRENA